MYNGQVVNVKKILMQHLCLADVNITHLTVNNFPYSHANTTRPCHCFDDVCVRAKRHVVIMSVTQLGCNHSAVSDC